MDPKEATAGHLSLRISHRRGRRYMDEPDECGASRRNLDAPICEDALGRPLRECRGDLSRVWRPAALGEAPHAHPRRRRRALSDGRALSRRAARRRPRGQISQSPSGDAVLMTDDRALHAHLIGRQGSRADLNTPVLVLDVEALDRNISAMAALVAAKGVDLRPHAKTHKSVDIAKRQLASGARGVCCAKIGEAEVLADGGVSGILITSPVAAPQAIRRLAALAARTERLMAVVDHPAVAQRLAAALADVGASIDVIIDVDPGIARTGVASAEMAVELARTIAALPSLRY